MAPEKARLVIGVVAERRQDDGNADRPERADFVVLLVRQGGVSYPRLAVLIIYTTG